MEVSIDARGVAGVSATLSRLRSWGTTRGTTAVVSDVHYAIFVEMGTWKMEANAGLRNAIDAVMSNAHVHASAASDVDDLIGRLANAIADRWREWVWIDTGKLRNSIRVERY